MWYSSSAKTYKLRRGINIDITGGCVVAFDVLVDFVVFVVFVVCVVCVVMAVTGCVMLLDTHTHTIHIHIHTHTHIYIYTDIVMFDRQSIQ